MTATVAPETATRPNPFQRQQVRDILWSCPALVAGGDLVLIYTPGRVAEASWICAQARASQVTVRLNAVPGTAQAVARKARALTPAGATMIVLADMTAQLPSSAIQLAGTATVSPVDLWRPAVSLAALASQRIERLSQRLTVGELTLQTGQWAGGGATVEAVVEQADGTFVADGAIAVNRMVTWDARLAGRPVTITVHNGAVTFISCPDVLLGRFLDRAVGIHLADRVSAVRIGVHPVACGFSAVAGPVNESHPGVTLRLRARAGRVYSTASADLCVDLTASAGQERE
jgi:hypothetical protein